MKNNLKRIIAAIGIIVLVGLYVMTFIFAVTGSSYFTASLYASIIIPILLFVYQLIYKVVNKNNKK